MAVTHFFERYFKTICLCSAYRKKKRYSKSTVYIPKLTTAMVKNFYATPNPFFFN